ncbi:hypothetical protein BKA62DRAFT_672016 [Auriculariales sp. MPI-PUGE-AT-0066]|nr:hypothetical protein BKA62DRAFT_672016 [Auriculariales sp. MPI-PUGE-AT-0066]
MTVFHNILFRGLNALYNQASAVSKGSIPDKHDLVSFGEEQVMFPGLETASNNAGLLAINVRQHESFHKGIEDLRNHLDSVKRDPQAKAFDATRLRALIDAFAPALVQHLHDEIPTLVEYSRRFPEVDVRPIEQRFSVHMRSKGYGASPVTGLTLLLPCMLACHDRDFNGGRWAAYLPGTARTLSGVAKFATRFAHRGVWRFAPCTFNSQLKSDMCVDWSGHGIES